MSEKTELKVRILEHATSRFLTHGFRNVSTGDLSAELGISKKTLYRHFASKDALLREVVFAQLDRIDREIRAVVDNPADGFIDSLERHIAVVGGLLTRLSETFLRDMARHAPALWREVERFRRERFFGRIEALIRGGIRAGAVRPEVDAKLTAELIIAMASNVISPRRLLELEVSPAEALTQIGLLVSRGLLTGPDSRQGRTQSGGQT